MEPNEALEQHQKNQEAREAAEQGHAFARRAAVIIAVLAALLAIATGVGNSATTETILKQGQATDTFNEYQANSLKRHINNDDAAILRLLSAASPNRAKALNAASKLESAVAKKYSPNQAKLLPKALDLEKERDKAENRHHTLQFAEGALQLAIVLCSVSIVVDVEALLYGGFLVGVAGLILLLMGGFSTVKLPF